MELLCLIPLIGLFAFPLGAVILAAMRPYLTYKETGE